MGKGTPVPFPFIPGLTPEAQQQLERDFLHIQTEFDNFSTTIGRHDFLSTTGGTGAQNSGVSANVAFSGAATKHGTSITQSTTASDPNNGVNIVDAGMYSFDVEFQFIPQVGGDSISGYGIAWSNSGTGGIQHLINKPKLAVAANALWSEHRSSTLWLPAGSLNLFNGGGSGIGVNATTTGGGQWVCNVYFRMARLV